MILDSISSVEDLRKLSIDDLGILSDEVREYIIDVIAENGGHLASSLGVVELTVALHYVFNTPDDVLIWDVGHQCYAHKILTGRKDDFRNIRKIDGISGFPKVRESVFDSYNVGHSSTSLSLAAGAAISRDYFGRDNKVVAVIGDGSLTGGMSFEALNNIGHAENDVIIILNDNEHSISKNVGALSRYLTRIITGQIYNKFRRRTMGLVKKIPGIGQKIFNFLYRFFESFKGMIIPGQLFEDMGIRYFGPVDGHNIHILVEILENVREINAGPKLIHIITKKGKGFGPAEKDPSRFHGIGPFDRETGKPSKVNDHISYSDIAGKTLSSIAERDDRIMAVTAAMKLGTVLSEFESHFPDRFFDVGIAEQHAVTFAASMARNGLKPFVSIYSTFMQRALDQVIHDVAIMGLPVRFLIDRAGIVGEDGETHHGVFDLSMFRSVPGMTILAPAEGGELRDMIYYAAGHGRGPIIIRYPKGECGSPDFSLNEGGAFTFGKISMIKEGKDIAIFGIGDMLSVSLDTADNLSRKGIKCSVYSITTVKPLDIDSLERSVTDVRAFITVENGVIRGGVGEEIIASLKPETSC